MQEKWISYLEESFSFQIGDLEEGEVFFFWGLCLGRWVGGLIPLKFVKKGQPLEVLQDEIKSFETDFVFQKMTH